MLRVNWSKGFEIFLKGHKRDVGVEILKEGHDEVLLELSRVKQQLKSVQEEHNHAILQLKKSEEKFKTIADYTYDWVYWLSPEGEILYNSPSCKGLTGYSTDEFFPPLICLHPLFIQMIVTYLPYTGKIAVILLKRLTISSSELLLKMVPCDGWRIAVSRCIM